ALVRFTRGHQPRGADNVRISQLNREMHWTGIGEAMEQERKQRAAPKNWKEVQAAYRLWVVAKGMTRKNDQRTTEKIRNRKGFDPVEVIAEYERRGEVPMARMLQQRVRYFTRGVAIGSSAWLEEVMSEYRSCFGGKRKKAGKRMQGGCWAGLEVLRQSGQNDAVGKGHNDEMTE
ncbi:MAG: hypothetical protein JJU29_22875, partial [Verrucomicrobia bacterium]|nr:hypothetical protein [Verrucomicrobiota bacterium]